MPRSAESLHLIDSEALDDVRQWAPPDLARRPEAPPRPPPTAAHLEALEQAAWDEGYRRGQAEGRRAGEAQVMAEAEPRLEALKGLIERLQTPLAADMDSVVESLGQLARALAERLVEDELRTEPSRLAPLLRSAVEALGENRGALRLRCAPGQIEALQALCGEQALDARLVADAALGPADLVIDAEPLSVDARMKTRLDRLFADWQVTP